MTSKQPAASALLSTVNDAHLLVEVHLSPNSFGGKLPPGATLRLAARVASGKVQFPSAVVSLLDASNQPTSLSSLFGFLSMDALHLWQPSEDCATFDVIARGRLLFIPLWKHIVTQIPVEIERIPSWVAQILSASARDIPSKAHATAAPDRNHFRRVRLDVTFDLLPGSKLPVNEATILTLAEDGRATVSVSGVGDYSVATVTDTNVSITFPRLTTSSSDVDVRVVLNRAESGVHLFALDETTLRNVGLKPAAGFSRPVLDEVNVRASKAGGGRKAYDFVVAIDPHSDFTVEGLIGEVTRRVGDPKVIAALKRTLLEKVDDGHLGEAPSVCTIDSSRWRMLDFITHDGRMHLEDAFDLPEIRLGMDDPAIDAVVKRLVPDLRLFATATQLQAVSEYDTDELVDAVKLLLTPNVRAVFDVIDPSVVPALLSALALPSLSINPTQVETASHRLHSSDTPHTPTIAPVLVRAGNSLNTHQRPRLRSAWASAGGLERNGRPYVLLASLVDALRASVSADPSSPDSLRELLSQVHTGPGLNLKLLVASDSIRAVAWASETVFPHGWGAVSEQLEGDVRRLYGRPDAHGGCAARVGTSAFCAQAARANDDAEGFFDAGVRFVGDGEEFLQQVAKLLDATSARAIG